VAAGGGWLPGTVFPLAPGHKVAGSTRPARVGGTAARHSDAIVATGEVMISMRLAVMFARSPVCEIERLGSQLRGPWRQPMRGTAERIRAGLKNYVTSTAASPHYASA